MLTMAFLLDFIELELWYWCLTTERCFRLLKRRLMLALALKAGFGLQSEAQYLGRASLRQVIGRAQVCALSCIHVGHFRSLLRSRCLEAGMQV